MQSLLLWLENHLFPNFSKIKIIRENSYAALWNTIAEFFTQSSDKLHQQIHANYDQDPLFLHKICLLILISLDFRYLIKLDENSVQLKLEMAISTLKKKVSNFKIELLNSSLAYLHFLTQRLSYDLNLSVQEEKLFHFLRKLLNLESKNLTHSTCQPFVQLEREIVSPASLSPSKKPKLLSPSVTEKFSSKLVLNSPQSQKLDSILVNSNQLNSEEQNFLKILNKFEHLENLVKIDKVQMAIKYQFLYDLINSTLHDQNLEMEKYSKYLKSNSKLLFIYKMYLIYQPGTARTLKPIKKEKTINDFLEKSVNLINNAEFYVQEGKITLARESFRHAFRTLLSIFTVITHSQGNFFKPAVLMPAMFNHASSSGKADSDTDPAEKTKNYQINFEFTPGVGKLNFAKIPSSEITKSLTQMTPERIINLMYQMLVLKLFNYSAYNFCLLCVNSKSFGCSIICSKSVSDFLFQIQGFEDWVVKFNLILIKSFIHCRKIDIGLDLLKKMLVGQETEEKDSSQNLQPASQTTNFCKTPANYSHLEEFFKIGDISKNSKNSDENNFYNETMTHIEDIFSDHEVNEICHKIAKINQEQEILNQTLYQTNLTLVEDLLENCLVKFSEKFRPLDLKNLELLVEKLNQAMSQNLGILSSEILNLVSKILPTLQHRTFNSKFETSFFDLENEKLECKKDVLKEQFKSSEEAFKTPPRSLRPLKSSSAKPPEEALTSSLLRPVSRSSLLRAPKAPRSSQKPKLRTALLKKETMRSENLCLTPKDPVRPVSKNQSLEPENCLKKPVKISHEKYVIPLKILENLLKNYSKLLKILNGLGESSILRILVSIKIEFLTLVSETSKTKKLGLVEFATSEKFLEFIQTLDDMKFYLEDSMSELFLQASKSKNLVEFMQNQDFSTFNFTILDQTFNQNYLYFNITKFCQNSDPISLNLKISRKIFHDMDKITLENYTSLKIKSAKLHWEARKKLDALYEKHLENIFVDQILGHFKILLVNETSLTDDTYFDKNRELLGLGQPEESLGSLKIWLNHLLTGWKILKIDERVNTLLAIYKIFLNLTLSERRVIKISNLFNSLRTF